MNDARAAGWLAAHALLLLLAFPGLETLQTHPPDAAWVAPIRAADQRTRGQLEGLFRPVERALGVRQSWQFYRTGASEVRRFEIHVDGELWYRSLDPDHRFDHAAMVNPRLRHLVKDWVRGKGAVYGPGLLRYAVARVRAVEPDAQRVRIVGLEGRWPGRSLAPSVALEGEAPDFTPRRVR